MNEKRNDRQPDKTGRDDGGMQRDPQPGRDREQQDRTQTGQVGGGGQEDKERQGQRGQPQPQKGGIGQPHKPAREKDEDVE